MIVKLLTEHHLEFLSSKGGCRCSSEPTLVNLSNCWKSHAAAHMSSVYILRHNNFPLKGSFVIRGNMKRNNVGKMITLIPLYCFFKAKQYTVIGDSGIFQEMHAGE